MRGLITGRLARSRRRLGDERGAVAVMVALLLVPLLGFGAIAVDVAAVHAERQALQNGADAAAMAIATDCAWNACGITETTATTLAEANSGSLSATLATPDVDVDLARRSITVTTSATQEHFFAPLIGVESSTATATSTAAWSGISHATSTIPMAISKCAYDKMVRGASITLYPGDSAMCGTGASAVPASIWLTTAGKCETTTSVGATLSRYVPALRTDFPPACRPVGFSFPLAGVIGEQVHLPVFEQASATAAPKVYGFVAFDVGEVKVNERSFRISNFWDLILFIILWWLDRLPENHGFKAIGTLGTSVEMSTAPVNTSSAPDLGARSVYLTERNPQ
ncbi:pilus assembly protein TadG-related protein [Blastococcus haudaquaticus]|uniref:Flp pilus assembly protein TadG n=1 Tax=Blastococcus haudaquaticus TaxID=1938745 RepID=A0A286H562_9ACTN|nr:pilus assembly protein TadG-related protein [Blastococcus haudaquaticus]SOE02940.1 Flp pilus assembly protein TadG [Blastococcus haudaquaticus]